MSNITEMVRRVRSSRFGCLAPGCDELRDTYLEIDEHMVTEHGERPSLANVLHYQLRPLAGQDLGPSACGTPGTVVLFRQNVTCPVCRQLTASTENGVS